MNNVIEIDGEKVVVAFDLEIRILRNVFVGLNGGADFYAKGVPQSVDKDRKSLTIDF